MEEVDTVATIADENRSKYVTSSYGFGIDHMVFSDYIHLPDHTH